MEKWSVEHSLAFMGRPNEWRATEGRKPIAFEDAVKFAMEYRMRCRPGMDLEMRLVSTKTGEHISVGALEVICV